MTQAASGDTAPLDVFLVAAEESGDRLGTALIRAIRGRVPNARFRGVGGRAMAAEGVPSLVPTESLSIMGYSAIPRRLPAILRGIAQTAAAIVSNPPDVLVLIDSPDFSHRVARRVRRRAPTIPIADYVSPAVWAWRPGRARRMRGYVDHILALLPFEPAVHERLGGPPCSYVGHPLIGDIGRLRPAPAEAARRMAEPPVLLVLPGSRSGEIHRHAPVFGETLSRLRAAGVAFDAVLPVPPQLETLVREAVRGWAFTPRIITSQEEKYAAFRMARAALTKSGTVTLELALSGVPMIGAYQFGAIDGLIARHLVRVPSIILANLVLGEPVVPEFLHGHCNPDALSRALVPLLRDSPERRRQIEAFARLDDTMEIGKASPADRAAEIVIAMGRNRSGR